MENLNQLPQKENITDALKKYKQQNLKTDTNDDFQKIMNKDTNPDLITSYEIIKLPSYGMYYPHKISQVNVEYMTSKDEDLLTTPSLIENGNVLDILLRRKIKTQGITPEELLPGDRNAIILFLRTSSYGSDYTVEVTDPRNNKTFKEVVNLNELKYKEITEIPDDNGYFSVVLPMRKKTVTFRLLSSGEENLLYKKAEAIKEAYNEEFIQYNTLKLKSSIIAIDDNRDRSYIDKFVDAMPALDALTIRKKILEVSPDVDMTYEFTAKDGYKFKATLAVGIDFFFPSNLAGEYKKMVDEEIYILTRNKFQAEYVENLPIYRRRHFLFLLQKEVEEVEKLKDKESRKYKR